MEIRCSKLTRMLEMAETGHKERGKLMAVSTISDSILTRLTELKVKLMALYTASFSFLALKIKGKLMIINTVNNYSFFP